MNITYKYRIYPDKEQTQRLYMNFKLCRELYNACIQERQMAYRNAHKSISYYDQQNQLPEIKEIRPELNSVHSLVQQDALHRVDKAFKAFFGRVKKGVEKVGYPHFKGRDFYNSITYTQSGFAVSDNKLIVSKIGKLKIKLHRPIKGKVKTCTIVKDGNHWYACLVSEVKVKRKVSIKTAVGIDSNLTCLAKLTTGETIENPRWLRRSEKKLIRECRRLSRRKLRGNNRKKQRLVLANTYRKIRNQRNDFQHKLSDRLVNTFDLIVYEDLAIKNMMQGYLSKSIADASWNGLCQKLAYKAELRGKYALPVSPRNTSQECSRCGEIVAKTLAVRIHRCSKCGLEMDRDLNASWNILHRGLEIYRRDYGNQRLGRGVVRLFGEPRSPDQIKFGRG